MNLYELNQSIMNSIPEEAIPAEEEIKRVIKDYHSLIPSGYYMLLSHHLRYYTVFVSQKPFNKEKFEDLVVECLQDMGKIVSVSVEQDALEFWVQDENQNSNCFYLFDYSSGIVPFGG